MSTLDRHFWSRKFKSWLVDSDFTHMDHQWPRADGLSRLIGIGKMGDKNRQTVLFLHGLGNDALFPNIEIFRHLLLAGYNIVAGELDGHGLDATTKLSHTSIMSLVREMVEQCDALIIGRPRLHFCGYSFGAALMLQYAVHNPERVRSLSMIGMPIHLEHSYLFLTEILTPILRSYHRAMKDYGLTGIHPAIGPILRGRYPVRLGAEETGNYFEVAAKVLHTLAPTELLRLVTFPTLSIAGSLDFIANLRATEELQKELSIQTFYLRGETHFSTMLTPKTPRRVEVLLRNAP